VLRVSFLLTLVAVSLSVVGDRRCNEVALQPSGFYRDGWLFVKYTVYNVVYSSNINTLLVSQLYLTDI